MLSLFILLLLWYRGSSSWEITSFVMTVGAGGILLFLLKEFYVRERPMFHPFIDVGGYSFPSGHATGAVLLYGVIIYSFRQNRPSPFQKWSFTIVVGIFIFLIGISRIYLGVHFPTDVLAGYFAGLAWLIACILPLEWKKRRS
ncbi:phosphatase PAP2 family protein [Aquibacillus sediminis]|uniref:phosphatase PAP2 family protein n=1 Tax=Aquibacillus sediminis TaxID=2574734 RepID=UPI001109D4D0|nr:phosphatase PAP2 family protein [Aquibacillus sediminis]